MKKNYTLKLALAILVVVLVSLVSFVGVYKGGKNLVKEYSLGKDFSKRKVATFSVVEENSQEAESEETQEDEPKEGEDGNSSENENNENKDENNNQRESVSDKVKNYKKAKNNIAGRLTKMNTGDFDIRLEEETGKIVMEVPEDMDNTFLSEVVTKGKVEIKNTSSNEVIADGKVFKDASAKIDTTTYTRGVVAMNFKFSNDAKKKIIDANPNYTDSEGNESPAKFAFVLDGETLYSDDASAFISSAESGEFNLIMGQSQEGEELQKDYQRALAIVGIIKCGEIPVGYQNESITLVASNIDINLIIIICAVVGVLMIIYAMYKFKLEGLFSSVSLIGFVSTLLLVLRYTNVKITLFTILGLAVVTIANYIMILKALKNKKSFKENFMCVMNMLIPCIIVAIVFCCSPYLQLASFGMAIFWGLIVMCLYDASIVRMIIEK